MSIESFEFVTDTSTLCVFDLAALRHRLQDDAPDWWVWEQVEELNAGNAAFLDLGSDGAYRGTLSTTPLEKWQFQVNLSCPSGQVFVGAAEETTSSGLEPDCGRGGLMLRVAAGTYELKARKLSGNTLELSLCSHEGGTQNEFNEPLRLGTSEA